MKLDRITFSEALPPGSSLRLAFAKPNSSVKAYLYRYQNQAFTFVNSFTDQYSFTNADQLVTAKATYLVLVVQNRCLDDCTGSLAVSLRFKVDTLIDLLQSSTNFGMGIDSRITFQDNWWSIGCDTTFPVKVSKTSFSSSGQMVPNAMSGCAPPVQDPKDAWNSAPADYTLDGSLNTDGTAISEVVIHIHKKGPSIGYTREDTIDIKVTYVPVDVRGGNYQNSNTYIGYRDPFPLAKAAVELKGTMIWTISAGVDKGKVVISNKIASWDASSGAVIGSFNRKVLP